MRPEPHEVTPRPGRPDRNRPGSSVEARARRRRMALEALEPKLLLATLPPATRAAELSSVVTGAAGDQSGPSVVVSRNDANRLVAAWSSSAVGGTPAAAVVSVSNNGGQSWGAGPNSTFAISALTDPTSPANAPVVFAQVTDVSVGIDRNDRVYVLSSHHNAGSTSGALVLTTFNLNDPGARTTTVLERWTDDTVIRPTLAVDDTLPAFIDPTTGDQVNNFNAGNVYVAWATNEVAPTGAPANYNPTRIRAIASTDGGLTFTGVQTVNDGGNSGAQRNTAPRLVVSQGGGGAAPGQVSVIWDDFGTGAGAGTPFDRIMADRSTATIQGLRVSSPGGPIADNSNLPPGTLFNAATSLTVNDTAPDPDVINDQPIDIVAASLDGGLTGSLDLVVANQSGRGATGTGSLTVFLNAGNSFPASGRTIGLPDGAVPRAIAVGDLREDNAAADNDIVVATNIGLFVLFNNGNGTFAEPRLISQLEFTSVAIADVDPAGTAGFNDIIATRGATNSVAIFRNRGGDPPPNQFPGEFQGGFSFPVGVNPVDLAVVDIDGDDRPEIITANRGSNDVTVLRNTSAGVGNITFDTANPFTIAVAAGPVGLATGLLDGDGARDIAVASDGTDEVTVLRNATAPGGPISLTETGRFGVGGDNLTALAVSDFNNDGARDIAVTIDAGPGADGRVAILQGNNTGIFAANAITYPAGRSPRALAAGNYDGTNAADLAVANFAAPAGTNNADADVSILTSTPSPSLPSRFSFNVDVRPGFTLSDLDLSIALTHATLQELQIRLIAPNGQSVTLVNFGTLTGANLGILPSGIVPTVFDSQAPRAINDATVNAPYEGRLRPINPLTAFNGLTEAQVDGTWVVEIVDNTATANAVQSVSQIELAFTSGLQFGNDAVVATTTVRGDLDGIGGLTASAASPAGIGPSPVLASDNTLGSFSVNRGRLYAAWVGRSLADGNPGDNTDIQLAVSDDGGLNWTTLRDTFNPVNDDLASRDGFSESLPGFNGRAQFLPALAVDQTTGTLVASWLDGRHDAERARVSTYLGTSVDGGRTFSPQVFVNSERSAIDAATNRRVVLGPQADNASGNGGFGERTAVAAAGGRAVAVWAGNENFNDTGMDILAGRVAFGAGPRVVSSTMGPIARGTEQRLAADGSLSAISYNDTRAADGTPVFDGFVVSFDRPVFFDFGGGPIDPSSFTPDDVRVFFRDTSAGNAGGVQVPVVEIIPLFDPDGATGSSSRQAQIGPSRFLVRVAPTSSVGTYSYAIGPNVFDRIRRADPNGLLLAAGNAMDQDADGTAGQGAVDGVGPGDVYAVPRPTARGAAFDVAPPNSPSTVNYPPGFILGPYDRDTLPIILYGPVQTTVTVPGEVLGRSLAVDRKVGGLDVAFDRDMIASSFGWTNDPNNQVANDILRVEGPAGPIAADPRTGAFLVRPVFRSTDPAAPIADGGSITTTLVVPDDGGVFLIDDLDVYLDIISPRSANLRIVLIAPDGTRVILADGAGGSSGRDFLGTVFDDAGETIDGDVGDPSLPPGQRQPRLKSVTPIRQGAAPFTGRFAPQDLLSLLDGKELRGVWRLEVTDLTGGDVAPGELQALLGWSLTAKPRATAAGAPPALAREFRVEFFRLATLPAAPGQPAQQVFVPDLQELSGSYAVELGSEILSSRGEALDQDRDAGLDRLRGFTPDQRTISSALTSPAGPVAIADASATSPSVTTSRLTITEDFLVQGLTVPLDIRHPRVSDLTIALIGPDGTRVTLFSPDVVRADGANLTSVTFDDNAATYVGDAGPPYSGATLRPQEPISRLFLDEAGNFKRSAGVYTLEITDSVAGPAGSAPALTQWNLVFRRSAVESGLGEEVADRARASFRVFTMAKDEPLSSTTWTAVGPAATAAGGVGPAGDPRGTTASGRVTAIAVDPSDPSGNTVYVGADGGGVWRTRNFLTDDPSGPTWQPLTDFGPNFASNIGAITVIPRNDDPRQSIIIAATGNGADLANFGGQDQTSRGVGFLRSVDGGQTWELLDSRVNIGADGRQLPISSPGRDRAFVGDSIFAVVADPTPLSAGNYALYAAVTGPDGGLWRSFNTGSTWEKVSSDAVHGTQATDVILDPYSRDAATGLLDRLYVGFRGVGVFLGASRGNNLTVLLDGGTANPLRQDPNRNAIPVSNPNVVPPNGNRFTLAQPRPTSSGASNLFYQDWLYAAAVDPSGDAVLYVTKDRGDIWTRVRLPAAALGLPSNDVSLGDRYDAISGTTGNEHLRLVVDPNDPNVVYLGVEDLVRIDLTALHDGNALVNLDPSSNDPGAPTPESTLQPDVNDPDDSPATLTANALANLGNPVPRAGGNLPLITDLRTGDAYEVDGRVVRQALNLTRNPVFPLAANATFIVSNTASINNTGAGATWNEPFGDLLGGRTGVVSRNITAMTVMADPVTGNARLLVGTDHGIYTGADRGGRLDPGIGTASIAVGARHGNLQIARVHYGAAQPSSLAAAAAGALFYAMTAEGGFPESDPNVLEPGSIALPFGASADYLRDAQLIGTDDDPFGIAARGSGTGVATAQVNDASRGALYQFKWPNNGGRLSDFFQVNDVGRTVGLLPPQSSSDPGQWPTTPVDYPLAETAVPFGNFAINPLSNDQAVISAADGTLYGTSDQGRTWRIIGQRTVFGGGPNPAAVVTGGYAPAVAFGAPGSGVTNPDQLDDFVYVGTTERPGSPGEIYVSTTGGGAAGTEWRNVSAGLDGSTVLGISANPARGSRDAYAITAGGFVRTQGADDTDDNTGEVPDGTTKQTSVTFNPDGGSFRVGNVAVTVTITHTGPDPAGATNDIREIDLFLVSPAGTRVRLTPVGGVPGDAFTGTTFDDVVGRGTLDTGASPYTGTFKAAEPLSAFYGEQLQGRWALEVVDRSPNGETASVTDVQITASSLGGVYYNADATAAGSSWTPIAGGLVAVQRQAFGQQALTQAALADGQLHALTVDWRYRLPDPNTPGALRPVVYVGGVGGVFRTIDQGQTWASFPDNIAAGDPGDGTPADSGYLPNVRVTDLDLSLGFINPDTGQYQTGPDAPAVLLASTFGRGQFAIRLAPIVVDQAIGLSSTLPLPSPAGSDSGIGVDPNSFDDRVTNVVRPTIDGLSEITGFDNTARVTLYDLTDPTDVRVIGGYDPADPITASTPDQSPDPAAANGRTDALGRFVHSEVYELRPGAATPIPDGGQVARSTLVVGPTVVGEDGTAVNLPASATVTDVDVRVTITHPRPADLLLRLVAERPDGQGGTVRTVVPLASNIPGNGVGNYSDTVFDDKAPTPIGQARAPFAGRFRPEGSLSAFNGLTAGGTWVLEAVDPATGEVGTIDDWTLFLRTSSSRELPGVRVLPGVFRSDGSTDGAKTIGIRVTDDSGVASPMTRFAFTLDTTAPAVPPAPVLQPGSDTNFPPTFPAGDNYTGVNRPTFDVAGVEANNGILLFRNGQLVASLFGVAGGTTAITDNGPDANGDGVPDGVPDGTYTYVVQQVDRSGNASPFSAPTVVTIDTVAPQAPSALAIDPADDSGTTGDGSTNVRTPRLVGQLLLSPNETSPENLPLVQLVGADGSVLGEARVAPDGVFSVRIDTPLADDVYVVQARAVDRAGNISPLGPGLALRIDTAAPPGISLGLSPTDDTGAPNDNVTSIRRPRLIGTTGAGLTVVLIDVNGRVPNSSPGAVVAGPVTSQANGGFLLQPPVNLPDGTYTLIARAINAAGNAVDSAPLVLTILNEVPAGAPTLRLAPESDTGLAGDGRTVERRPFFVGEAEANSTVEIVGPDGAVLAIGTADAQGTYRLRLASDLTNGSITLRARSRGASGVAGPFSLPLNLKIETAYGDYDNDARADLVLYRPGASDGDSLVLLSRSTGDTRVVSSADFRSADPASPLFNAQLRPDDTPITGDFDGDGRADVAIFRPSSDRLPQASEWLILGSRIGPRSILFGGNSLDLPAPGDYDGDGVTDLAVFRPVSDLLPGAAEWFILPSSTGQGYRLLFGGAGGLDVPAPGDFDGDGRDDVAVFRPNSDLIPGASQWFILPSRPNDVTYSQKLGGYSVLFGQAGVDQPVPLDYDGDGRDDVATYRPTSSEWFILRSGLPVATAGLRVQFGSPGDLAAPADYDGDGIADLAAFRPAAGQWTVRRSRDGQDQVTPFGGPGDIPVLGPLAARTPTPAPSASSAAGDAGAGVGQARQAAATPLDLGTQAAQLSRSSAPQGRSARAQDEGRPTLAARLRDLRAADGEGDRPVSGFRALLASLASRRRPGGSKV